jgi:hypothetical protein
MSGDTLHPIGGRNELRKTCRPTTDQPAKRDFSVAKIGWTDEARAAAAAARAERQQQTPVQREAHATLTSAGFRYRGVSASPADAENTHVFSHPDASHVLVGPSGSWEHREAFGPGSVARGETPQQLSGHLRAMRQP